MKELQIQYKKILQDYIDQQTERNLYIAQLFIRQLILKQVTPEDVIYIHKQAMEEICPNLADETRHGYDFLIEIMVHFGLTLRERQSLLEQQEVLRIEMDVAANIQSVMLHSPMPQVPNIDVGMRSIPFRKMNGDYVHFATSDEKYIAVAVTDVVGKGVPAALCMSMIKYGLETLEYADNRPSSMMKVLNRIIEKSIGESMFVSMFYGRFDFIDDIFTYSSAGHEPGFYYKASQQTFYDLDSKGLLFGILPESEYEEVEIQLEEGDFVMMVTDGVTEIREGNELELRNFIESLALEKSHLTAQQMCDSIYDTLKKHHKNGLEDDFTIVIFKR